MKTIRATRPLLGVLLCVSLLLALLGCAKAPGDTPPSPPMRKSPRPALHTPNSAPATASDGLQARFPLENYDYIAGELKNYRAINAQPLVVDENAYALAEVIYRYRDYHNTLIFDLPFSDITAADAALLVEVAASQTPHIDLYSDAFSAAPPQHPVRAFYDSSRASGMALSLLSYGDDVRRTAKSLYGDAYELPRRSGRSIRYNDALDLYYLDAEGATLSTDYPLITSIQPSDTPEGGFTVETVRLCYWDSYNKWSTPDSSWESSEGSDTAEVRAFVNRSLEKLPRSRYTLAPAGTGWRIASFSAFE